MTDIHSLTAADVPSSFVRCFIDGCPLADSCVRHLAGQQLPADATCGLAVFPNARQGDACMQYKPVRTIRAAWGFNALFADIKRKDSAPLRQALRRMLGGNGSYYRYHHGGRLLTPEQQEAIAELFSSRGYTGPIAFDGYRDLVDLT